MTLDYYTYFEALAADHLEIRHQEEANGRVRISFAQIDMGELTQTTVRQGSFPFMGIAEPRYGADGGFVNPGWKVTGGLVILDKADERADLAQKIVVENKCRRICEEIAARMLNDRKIYVQASNQFFIRDLEPNEMSMQMLSKTDYAPLVGCMLTFGYRDKALAFDESKWDTGKKYTL